MYFYSDQPVIHKQISTAPHHLLPTSLFTAHLSLLPLGVVHSHRWGSWVWRLCSWQQGGRSRDIAALQHARTHIFVAPANSNCKRSTVDSFKKCETYKMRCLTTIATRNYDILGGAKCFKTYFNFYLHCTQTPNQTGKSQHSQTRHSESFILLSRLPSDTPDCLRCLCALLIQSTRAHLTSLKVFHT